MAAAQQLVTGNLFLETKVEVDFCDPSTPHDRVLIVEGKRFYVVSMHLSMYSYYFSALFNSNFQEKEKKEIELKDVEADPFEVFLKMLHPVESEVTKDNLNKLLNLSNMFLIPIVWQNCVKFMENRDNLPLFRLDELLEWLKITSSEIVKKNIENYCVRPFKTTEVAKFLGIAEEHKFVYLQEKIVKHISKGVSQGFRDICRMVIVNNLDEFKVAFAAKLEQRGKPYLKERYSVILLHVLIELTKYDIPKIEAFFTHYFIVEAPSKSEMDLLVSEGLSLNIDHKTKLKEMLLMSADSIKQGKLNIANPIQLGNVLLEFSYLFHKSISQNTISEALKLVESFPCGLQLADVQMFVDSKWVKHSIDKKRTNFLFIELALSNNLTESKTEILNWLEKVKKENLPDDFAKQVKSSAAVAKFVRECLSKNTNEKDIVKLIFG